MLVSITHLCIQLVLPFAIQHIINYSHYTFHNDFVIDGVLKHCNPSYFNNTHPTAINNNRHSKESTLSRALTLFIYCLFCSLFLLLINIHRFSLQILKTTELDCEKTELTKCKTTEHWTGNDWQEAGVLA